MLTENNINIPNWRKKYRKIKLACENCMRKGYHRTIRSDFGEITPDRINEEWSLDIAGPLNPRSKLGNKYMLVAVEGFFNKIWAKALKDTSAKSIIRAVEELMSAWGRPESVRVDSGTYFVGGQLEEWLNDKHIMMNKSLRYSPQSNALAERAIGSIKSFFRANHNDTTWDEHIEEALYFD